MNAQPNPTVSYALAPLSWVAEEDLLYDPVANAAPAWLPAGAPVTFVSPGACGVRADARLGAPDVRVRP